MEVSLAQNTAARRTKDTIITRLADFTAQTKYEDLPPEAVEESKRIILDSIGCALAGATSEKGKGGLALARQFGGVAEATVIGFGDKVSVWGAAFANGELINSLDYDALLFPGHLTPFMLPAYLAAAESRHSSGKELLLTNALAHEISHRIGRAMTYLRDINNGREAFPPVFGYSCSIFGGAAGVGRIKGFDAGLLADAMGMAGQISPAHSMTAWAKHTPSTLAKYLVAGWLAQGCLTAASLAELRYRGDIDILEGEFGYWRYMGSTKWEPQLITDQLGKEWRFQAGQIYKPYPHCRVMHGPFDCLLYILEENDIKPEEIESITIWGDNVCDEPIWTSPIVETQADAQFSMAHGVSVAAHRIPPGPEWQDYETIMSPSVLALMERITIKPHPGFVDAILKEPLSRMSKAEVKARGKTFTEERRYPKGTPSPQPETFMTNEELIAKFKHNAQRILPWHKIDAAVEAVMEIEHMDDVSRLMNLVAI
ncbi:MmgE/PrpD family protein [Chloroflexota bacterium]